jgi:Fis family transcriptional regulator
LIAETSGVDSTARIANRAVNRTRDVDATDPISARGAPTVSAVVHLPLKPRDLTGAREPTLAECVGQSVRRYLADLGSSEADDLYDTFLREIELPLLREVMAWADGNQSRAAQRLGLSRATLRKKLNAHGLL